MQTLQAHPGARLRRSWCHFFFLLHMIIHICHIIIHICHIIIHVCHRQELSCGLCLTQGHICHIIIHICHIIIHIIHICHIIRQELSCGLCLTQKQVFDVGARACGQVSIITLISVITLLSEVTLHNGTDSFIVPIARSYNGNDWEKESGRIVEDTMYELDWYCYYEACEIDLPGLASGRQYKLSSSEASLRYTDPALNANDNVVARFLESATFGSTQADIDTINGGTGTRRRLAVEDNINSWIIDQMDETRTPATSHREYWRARANPSVSPFYLFELL